MEWINENCCLATFVHKLDIYTGIWEYRWVFWVRDNKMNKKDLTNTRSYWIISRWQNITRDTEQMLWIELKLLVGVCQPFFLIQHLSSPVLFLLHCTHTHTCLHLYVCTLHARIQTWGRTCFLSWGWKVSFNSIHSGCIRFPANFAI